MREGHDPDRHIVDSWRVNATPWIRAVRNHEIESRRLVTDRAIVDAVLSRAPGSVLDLGCGEGWLARELASRGIEVTGVDVVPELVHAARKAGGAAYVLTSYEDIAAGGLDVSVDAVVCNFSLIGGRVVDDLVAVVPSLLNEGGVLIIQTLHPVGACGDHPYRDGWREGSWVGFNEDFTDPAPWYFRTIDSWVGLLRSAGFDPVGIDEPRFPDSDRPASLLLIGTRAARQAGSEGLER